MNVSEFLTALSPIILTTVATYILIKQYLLDKRRFKLEHFDKRYRLYKKTMDYLAHLIANAKTDTKELLDFKHDTNDVKIFFSNDIVNKVDEIYSKAIRLRYCNKMIESSSLKHASRIELVKEENEILTWLGDQISLCESMFAKYLKI